MKTATDTRFTIGALAKAAGVGIDTVRFYERERLLPEPPRRASGYREYAPESVQRLRFIRRAKALGFTLDEIRELLALSTDREHGVAGVRQRAERRAGEIEQRIRELRRVQRGLKRLIEACPGRGRLDACPILATLGGKETS